MFKELLNIYVEYLLNFNEQLSSIILLNFFINHLVGVTIIYKFTLYNFILINYYIIYINTKYNFIRVYNIEICI